MIFGKTSRDLNANEVIWPFVLHERKRDSANPRFRRPSDFAPAVN
jgi:hypothetical protein